MHLLDTYALHCGLKVDKPYIYTLYYPLGIERYITFQPFSNFAEKQYDYWNEVIGHLNPILEDKSIKVVQIGAKDDAPMKQCIWTQGTTKISQAAYLIKNGILHLGVDSFGAHVASGFSKKIVCLYSTNWANNCRPYWSDPKDIRLFEPDRSESKPTFNHEEGPNKSINKIKPEDIANSVLELLGSEDKVNKESVFFGDDYNKMKISLVPSSLTYSLKELGHLIVRMDLHLAAPQRYIPELDMTLTPTEMTKYQQLVGTIKPVINGKRRTLYETLELLMYSDRYEFDTKRPYPNNPNVRNWRVDKVQQIIQKFKSAAFKRLLSISPELKEEWIKRKTAQHTKVKASKQPEILESSLRGGFGDPISGNFEEQGEWGSVLGGDLGPKPR